MIVIISVTLPALRRASWCIPPVPLPLQFTKSAPRRVRDFLIKRRFVLIPLVDENLKHLARVLFQELREETYKNRDVAPGRERHRERAETNDLPNPLTPSFRFLLHRG
jgi:hypothetical protein